jgi:hypothetical protein
MIVFDDIFICLIIFKLPQLMNINWARNCCINFSMKVLLGVSHSIIQLWFGNIGRFSQQKVFLSNILILFFRYFRNYWTSLKPWKLSVVLKTFDCYGSRNIYLFIFQYFFLLMRVRVHVIFEKKIILHLVGIILQKRPLQINF